MTGDFSGYIHCIEELQGSAPVKDADLQRQAFPRANRQTMDSMSLGVRRLPGPRLSRVE